jgi:hypothetical protein
MRKINFSILVLVAVVLSACSREENLGQPTNTANEETIIKDPMTP